MPGLVSLASLKTQVLQRADMENTSFIDSAASSELETYIKDSAGELFDLIIEEGGHELFIQVSNFTTTAGTAEYTLSAETTAVGGVYKILDVTVVWDSIERRTKKARFHERFEHRVGQSGWRTYSDIRYIETGVNSVGNRQITFFPTPQGAYEINVYYIPVPNMLFHDGTKAIDFQGYSGWDEYIVVDAAMKCLEKEESNTQHLQLRKLQLIERIRHQAQHMNHGDGDTIRDVSCDSELYLGRP